MLEPQKMGKVVVSVSFHLEIFKLQKKMSQIDPEIVEKFDVFVVFYVLFVGFLRDFVINSITNNKEITIYAFFEENVTTFCYKKTSD